MIFGSQILHTKTQKNASSFIARSGKLYTDTAFDARDKYQVYNDDDDVDNDDDDEAMMITIP